MPLTLWKQIISFSERAVLSKNQELSQDLSQSRSQAFDDDLKAGLSAAAPDDLVGMFHDASKTNQGQDFLKSLFSLPVFMFSSILAKRRYEPVCICIYILMGFKC